MPCPHLFTAELLKPYVNPTRFRWLLDDNNIGGWSLMIADTG